MAVGSRNPPKRLRGGSMPRPSAVGISGLQAGEDVKTIQTSGPVSGQCLKMRDISSSKQDPAKKHSMPGTKPTQIS